jgi:transposase
MPGLGVSSPPELSRHYWHLGIKNAIRPCAVGKKNWLFIGHPEAGWRAAVIYTLIVSCRRRGIEPWEYLRDVLQRLPALQQSELHTLLPANWKPA